MSETPVTAFEDLSVIGRVTSDISDVEWLLESLNLKGRSLKDRHPLRNGIDAMQKLAKNEILREHERRALGNLQLQATFLRQNHERWSISLLKVSELLRDGQLCASTLFEIDVGQILNWLGLQPIWKAFATGEPDWYASGVEVECKLARSLSKASGSNYGQYLSEVATQFPDRRNPLVVAVGFQGLVSSTEALAMRDGALRHVPWLTRHPEVSAAVVLAEEFGTKLVTRAGIQRWRFGYVTVTEIRNEGAHRPLPSTIHFGQGLNPWRGSFPGPMRSLTKSIQESRE